MNWLFSVIFLIFYLNFNNILGNFIICIFDFKKRSSSQTIIYGFLTTSFIQWLIGFPCQLLHFSWNIYFYILLSVYAIILVMMFKYRYIINGFKLDVKSHFKNYWVMYIMASVFLFWSISSQMPYLEMNYDDHYYIGAIVQQVGSSALSSENFFTGTAEVIPFVRIVNTYEINYGFWATLFHIDLPFFARGTMTFHNYLLVFMSFHAFFSVFLKRYDKYLQFIVLPFTILLIPGYFLQVAGILKMYDDWQFNTAIWYGGSIVRTISIPICLMLGNEWIHKVTIKKTVFALITCVALLSYSSIFLTFAISMFIVIIFMFIYKQIQLKKNFKWLSIMAGYLVLILCVIKIGPILLESIAPEYTVALADNLKEYIYFRGFYGAHSYVFIIYAITLLILYMKIKDSDFRRLILGIVVISIILYSGLFDKFFILLSFNVVFVGLRLMTGLQLVLISFVGFLLYLIIEKFRIYKLSSLSVIGLLLCFSLFNIKNESMYKAYAYPGTGLSSYGFDFSRIVSNTKLIPKVHSDIGEYFRENETSDRHRVISPYTIPYENGVLHVTAGLIMTANNIEVCMSDNYIGMNDMNWEIGTKFNSFVNGDIPYAEVKDLLLDLNVEYIITPSSIVVNSLLDEQMELVVISVSLKDDVVYMLKTNIN